MPDHIEKSKIDKLLCDLIREYNRDALGRESSAVFEALSRIRYLPAADVVPVVRCADCKWFQINMRQDGYLPDGVPEWECRHWCGTVDPTDYCSYGVKMDGDGE